MNRTPNWKDLELQGQCGVCAYYEPRYKGEMLTAHGTCTIRKKYKQRDERCKKYEIKGDI